MGAFNQLNGAIFDAGAIEARISAVDGKSIYNQRDGGILDFDSLARRLTALDGKIAVGQGGIEFDVDSFMRRLAAIEAGLFTPASIFAAGTAGIWLDPSDIGTGFQDSAGTTPQTVAGQPTGKRLDKSGRANHFLQATTTSRPIYNVAGAISTDTLDGVDDGYGTSTFAGGTLTADMDYFVAIKRAASTAMVVGLSNGPAGGSFFGAAEASAIPSSSVVGTPTNWVDGVAMTDQNRNTLSTALTAGTWHILEVRDVNLASWTQATLGSYTAFMVSGDIGGLILCPAQSTAIRNSIRTWLGAKVGLVL